jgi:acetyltransferase
MAVQHCVIDYEREIAIVAETTDKSVRKLIGVAQLLADATHETAEYAVLVPDPWQGKGLGRMLLDHSLELARRWGIKRIVAETDPQNSRMLNAFARRGFQADVHREEEVVFLQKWLVPPPVPATTGGKAHTA